MSAPSESEIIDGVEWVTIYHADGDGVCPQCARCGSSVEHVRCYECGGDGTIEQDRGDDVCPDRYEARCPACRGTGGHWHCVSSPEWCEANPLPDRAHIPSTALSSEAWRDVL